MLQKAKTNTTRQKTFPLIYSSVTVLFTEDVKRSD